MSQTVATIEPPTTAQSRSRGVSCDQNEAHVERMSGIVALLRLDADATKTNAADPVGISGIGLSRGRFSSPLRCG